MLRSSSFITAVVGAGAGAVDVPVPDLCRLDPIRQALGYAPAVGLRSLLNVSSPGGTDEASNEKTPHPGGTSAAPLFENPHHPKAARQALARLTSVSRVPALSVQAQTPRMDANGSSAGHFHPTRKDPRGPPKHHRHA